MINAIQRKQLIKLISYTGNKRIPVGKSVMEILDNLGISTVKVRDKDTVLLTTMQKLSLKKYIKDVHGEDLEKNTVEDSLKRFDLAKEIPDEKRGHSSVFGSLLNFSGNTTITFKDKSSIAINPNAIVSCEIDNLDTESISSLVVVENGTNIIKVRELIELLPESLKNSLILYKGHGDNAAQVHSLIEKLTDSCKIYFFFDYDPAGLSMMISEGLKRYSSLLLPEELSSDVIRLNKKECFEQQYSYMQSLYEKRNEFSLKIKHHIELMNDREYAITQENMVAHKVRLEIVPLE